MEYRDISQLHNWDKNNLARQITDVNWNKLITDIKRRGVKDAFKIAQDGTVYDGNHRLKALNHWIAQGTTIADNGVSLTQVPIEVIDPQSETEKWEVAFTGNEGFASWNRDGLTSYQGEWEALELSLFNIEFDDPESIDEQLFEEEHAPRDKKPKEVECPECHSKFIV